MKNLTRIIPYKPVQKFIFQIILERINLTMNTITVLFTLQKKFSIIFIKIYAKNCYLFKAIIYKGEATS